MPKSRNPRLCDFCQIFDDAEGLGNIGTSFVGEGYLLDKKSRSLCELVQNVDCIMCSFIVGKLIPECYSEIPSALSIPEPRIYLGPSAIIPS